MLLNLLSVNKLLFTHIYHLFTINHDLRDLWIRVLKIGTKVASSMRICSRHFKESDYILPSIEGLELERKGLKKDSIPSQNLPRSSALNVNESSAKEERQIRYKKYSIICTSDVPVFKNENHLSNDAILINRDKNLSNDEKVFDNEESLSKEAEASQSELQGTVKIHCTHFLGEKEVLELMKEEYYAICQRSYIDDIVNDNVFEFNDTPIDIPIDLNSTQYSFFDSLKTDLQLSTATGISSFALFDKIVKSVKLVPHQKIYGTILNIRDKCLMTFLKLKQNLSYAFLYILFPTVTQRYCSEITCNMIDILYEILKPNVPFASFDEILRNIPLCFVDYPNT